MDYPDFINPISDAYTVVIFSSPIKDWFKRLGTGVLYISWPLVKKYHNENGTLLVSTIFNTLTVQLKSETFLRIVCIDALDPNGELSGGTAKSILDYLTQCIKHSKKNKSAIDVIILPRFSPTVTDPGEIMQLLWNLKKRTVLISNSSLHSSLPSTETISVTGATILHETPASVIDFLVTATETPTTPKEIKETKFETTNEPAPVEDMEWLDINLARYKAPGVIAAISLDILDSLRKNYADLVYGKI